MASTTWSSAPWPGKNDIYTFISEWIYTLSLAFHFTPFFSSYTNANAHGVYRIIIVLPSMPLWLIGGVAKTGNERWLLRWGRSLLRSAASYGWYPSSHAWPLSAGRIITTPVSLTVMGPLWTSPRSSTIRECFQIGCHEHRYYTIS